MTLSSRRESRCYERIYTVRLKMPDGYRIASYWHPKRENVTVVSGTFKVGMGDRFDENKMGDFPTAGSFAYLDPDMHHYAMAAEKSWCKFMVRLRCGSTMSILTMTQAGKSSPKVRAEYDSRQLRADRSTLPEVVLKPLPKKVSTVAGH